jgi:hypothetical protein
MKSIIITLTLLCISNATFARQVTTETLYTCQQEDGDQWIEVGIALNDGPGLRALVVAHDEDDRSSKLISSRLVRGYQKEGALVYEDASRTIRVNIKKNVRIITASLTLLRDGPGSISISRLSCEEKGLISYQIN